MSVNEKEEATVPARVIVLLLVCAVGVHVSAVSVHGQALTSGSNGSDGALNLTTPGEVLFDPVALGFDADRDNVFHFTTITVAPGVTVRMPSSALQGLPIVWLATGAVQIDGTIDLRGQDGADAVTGLPSRGAAESGAGGYPGGVGTGGAGFAGAELRAGLGPGGGPAADVFVLGGIGTEAGHAVAGGNIFGTGFFGVAYGNALLIPLRGGSGVGGGGTPAVAGGGGGAGGGALRIFSSTSIAVGGTITADGGAGGSGIDQSPGCCITAGGGGSGGSIHLIAPTISGSGILSAKGGGHGLGVTGYSPASSGRIRLDALIQGFTGTIDSFVTKGTPYNVPLPAAFPRVRVTTIAGIPVAAGPTGDASAPDATIDTSGPVTVAIEARNVPIGTVLQVRVISEASPDFVVNSTPLSGTEQVSTATAEVTFPPGFSRGVVRATWNPPSP
jgi:hypothetical protein